MPSHDSGASPSSSTSSSPSFPASRAPSTPSPVQALTLDRIRNIEDPEELLHEASIFLQSALAVRNEAEDVCNSQIKELWDYIAIYQRKHEGSSARIQAWMQEQKESLDLAKRILQAEKTQKIIDRKRVVIKKNWGDHLENLLPRLAPIASQSKALLESVARLSTLVGQHEGSRRLAAAVNERADMSSEQRHTGQRLSRELGTADVKSVIRALGNDGTTPEETTHEKETAPALGDIYPNVVNRRNKRKPNPHSRDALYAQPQKRRFSNQENFQPTEHDDDDESASGGRTPEVARGGEPNLPDAPDEDDNWSGLGGGASPSLSASGGIPDCDPNMPEESFRLDGISTPVLDDEEAGLAQAGALGDERNEEIRDRTPDTTQLGEVRAPHPQLSTISGGNELSHSPIADPDHLGTSAHNLRHISTNMFPNDKHNDLSPNMSRHQRDAAVQSLKEPNLVSSTALDAFGELLNHLPQVRIYSDAMLRGEGKLRGILPGVTSIYAAVHHPAAQHWTLVELNPTAKVARHYDSLLQSDARGQSTLSHFLQRLGWSAEEWELRETQSPQQVNCHACGVFVIVSLLHRVAGQPLPARKYHCGTWRHILSAIISGEALKLRDYTVPHGITLNRADSTTVEDTPDIDDWKKISEHLQLIRSKEKDIQNDATAASARKLEAESAQLILQQLKQQFERRLSAALQRQQAAAIHERYIEDLTRLKKQSFYHGFGDQEHVVDPEVHRIHADLIDKPALRAREVLSQIREAEEHARGFVTWMKHLAAGCRTARDIAVAESDRVARLQRELGSLGDRYTDLGSLLQVKGRRLQNLGLS